MAQKIDPIAKKVIETFEGVYNQVVNFATNPESAINGMLVNGDAGTGKSFWVKKALRDTGANTRTEYIKGGTITAASLYVKLALNAGSHRIIVLDDVDIVHHPERNKIIPMVLGAADTGRDRLVTWSTAKKNALMEENNIDFEFLFNGNIIWITNDTKETIKKSAKQWATALDSRFNSAECIFNREQKLQYTKYLIEQCDMLGGNCVDHKYDVDGDKVSGYPPEIIESTYHWLEDNYEQLGEVTPRVALKIADTKFYNKDAKMQRIMLNQLKNIKDSNSEKE
jgi:hypothetical protein